MNIEQITDKYLDKLCKIDPLDDFMWKKKELMEFAGFVLESVIPKKKKETVEVRGETYKWVDEIDPEAVAFNEAIDQIRHNAGLED